MEPPAAAAPPAPVPGTAPPGLAAAPSMGATSPASGAAGSSGPADRSAMAKEATEPRTRQMARAAPGPVVAGRLGAADREAAARAVEALVEQLGGQAVRVPAGPADRFRSELALDLALPEGRYAELASGLARLGPPGSWRPEHEPGPAVAGLRRLRIVVD